MNRGTLAVPCKSMLELLWYYKWAVGHAKSPLLWSMEHRHSHDSFDFHLHQTQTSWVAKTASNTFSSSGIKRFLWGGSEGCNTSSKVWEGLTQRWTSMWRCSKINVDVFASLQSLLILQRLKLNLQMCIISRRVHGSCRRGRLCFSASSKWIKRRRSARRSSGDVEARRNQRLEAPPCNYWPLRWVLIDVSWWSSSVIEELWCSSKIYKRHLTTERSMAAGHPPFWWVIRLQLGPEMIIWGHQSDGSITCVDQTCWMGPPHLLWFHSSFLHPPPPPFTPAQAEAFSSCFSHMWSTCRTFQTFYFLSSCTKYGLAVLYLKPNIYKNCLLHFTAQK